MLSVPASITYGTTGTATTTGGSGTGAVTFSDGASTGCSVNVSTGVISVNNASGTCVISASKAGDNNYLGPVSDGPTGVTLNKASQAALVLSVPASITYGTTGTATTTGGSGTGAVTFSDGASTGCSVNVSTGVISVNNASGTCADQRLQGRRQQLPRPRVRRADRRHPQQGQPGGARAERAGQHHLRHDRHGHDHRRLGHGSGHLQ